MNRSLATVCCLLALAVTACAGSDSVSQDGKAETPSAWEGILVAELHLPEPGAPAVEALSRLLEQGRATAGVQQIAITDTLPGPPDSRELHDVSMEGSTRPVVGLTRTISGDYFKLMRIPVLRGRAFDANDHQGGISVAVASEAFGKWGLHGAEPLGRRVRTQASSEWLTVVGLAQDAPRSSGMPEIYTPYTLAPGGASWFVLVRTDAAPAGLAASLRQILSATPGAQLGELKSLAEV